MPGNGLGCAQRSFFNLAMGRLTGNTAKANLLNSKTIGGAKNGANIVHAAHIVQNNGNGQLVL